MLVAKTGDGCLVSLISSNYSRSALISLKTKKRFFFVRSVCGRAVTLKMGSKRKWHFAHDPNQPCLLESEPESAAHLSGKEDLFFFWLESRGLKPELEFYLPQIKQRPDILLPRPLPGVAFEYQCSSIAADIWMKRTMGYIQAGIQPLWLIGSRRQRKKGFISKLSGFEPLAIRSAPKMLIFTIHSHLLII
ncbi:competence protein CoiA family protein [Terrilactibacillus sp. S3-3]|nr:competence protein CoiA family protein [Terrilactibacillus sp. S3-3]